MAGDPPAYDAAVHPTSAWNKDYFVFQGYHDGCFIDGIFPKVPQSKPEIVLTPEEEFKKFRESWMSMRGDEPYPSLPILEGAIMVPAITRLTPEMFDQGLAEIICKIWYGKEGDNIQ